MHKRWLLKPQKHLCVENLAHNMMTKNVNWFINRKLMSLIINRELIFGQYIVLSTQMIDGRLISNQSE